MEKLITNQIEALRSGFSKIIPLDLIKDFTPEELRDLWLGEPLLDLNYLINNTVYSGDYSEDHKVIKWLWEYARKLDQQSLQILFRFITGMSRLPAGGMDNISLKKMKTLENTKVYNGIKASSGEIQKKPLSKLSF